MSLQHIHIRGARVHNLRNVDLEVPHGQLVVFCGVSGSGKTSLALDTLYAEGRRRYIESFSAYTRQFLEQLEKPDVEHIEGLPPAVAVTHKETSRSARATVGAATEIDDYLRLLFAKIGRVYCAGCGREVQRDTPATAAAQLERLPAGKRYLVAFARELGTPDDLPAAAAQLREDGFVRVLVGERLVSTTEETPPPMTLPDELPRVFPIVDRLTAGSVNSQRVLDSLETAFAQGSGRVWAFIESSTGASAAKRLRIEGADWDSLVFSRDLRCEACDRDYPDLDPRLFSFNSPLGACPTCEGFGNIVDVDMDLVVPDPGKSLREGAIAPWNTPAYAHELQELLALAADYGVPVDIPYRQLTAEHRRLIQEGVPERKFGGLKGFFAWLEKRKYKMHLRVFASRWKSYYPCPACGGARLRPESLCTRIGDKNIAELQRAKIADVLRVFRTLSLSDWEGRVARMMLDQIVDRLGFLERVGLGYLSLDRMLRTLSGGEAQRVALTSALGSSLVNMLYVLDEPSVGLHPRDVHRLIGAIQSLRDRGNTVVLVEHEESLLQAADRIVELGPGAGERGGEVVFQGSLPQLLASEHSLTGDFLTGRRGVAIPERRRTPNHGWIRLVGARGNNLRDLTVEFPLGILCLVTGVSGAGKSTLVEDTLYAALCQRKRKEAPKPFPFQDVYGDGQIDDVILIDQSAIGRSPRSNPVTYVKAFDEIRSVFAETVEARTRNYTAGHFSFNVEGGRCPACEGDGCLQIDMQFLADVYMTCDQCQGKRYRREILDVAYRGRNIADVLSMTVREAFSFFRGQAKVQEKLKRLIDVGLDYLRLGQPANTLSAGEAQRLKLAAYISSARRRRTLFLMDEPTTGLHYADIVQLLDCFDALLAVGHSLIIVEHNLQMMKAADYIIDVGPGAAEEGGQIVVQGTPEKVARCRESATGRLLASFLADRLQEQTA